MVHPGQVISQCVFLLTRPGYIPPERNNLFFIPYFLHLAGDEAVLDQHTQALEVSERNSVPFLGRVADLGRLTPIHVDWIEKQIGRIEQATAGGLRGEVARYLGAIRSQVGPAAGK
jgi:hypothetical protein